MRRHVNKLWFKVAVSAGLLLLLALVVPWSEVARALRRLSFGDWALALTGVVVIHSVGVLKWRRFINTGHSAIGRLDAAMCYSAGLFANVCLPSVVGGDVLRMTLAGRVTKRPESAFLGGVLDRLTDLAALSVLVVGGAMFSGRSLPSWGRELTGVTIVIALAVFGLALPFIFRRPLATWPRKFRRPVGRALVVLRRLARDPKSAMIGLGLSILIQSGFVLLCAFLGREIGIHISLGIWFLVWPLAKIAGLMPISLGGLAVREATMAALLAPFGVPFPVGLLCSLLWQTMLIGSSLLAGLVWLVLSRVRAAAWARPLAVIGHPEEN